MRGLASRGWLDRFERPRGLGTIGPCRLFAAMNRSDAEPRVVLVARPEAEPQLAIALLDRLAAAHATIESPSVPALEERGQHGETEFVSLHCDADITFQTLRETAGSAGVERIPFRVAFGLVLAIADALAAGHATTHPDTGRPWCIEALSTRELLVAQGGRLYVLWTGQRLHAPEGARGQEAHVFSAPEVLSGGTASPSSDIYAAVQLWYSLLPFVDLPPRLDRAMRGEADASDAELAHAVDAIVSRTIYATPGRRLGSIAEFMALQEQIWRLLDMRPDAEAFREHLARLYTLGRGSVARSELAVGEAARWVRLPTGERIDLRRRQAPRRILMALVAARLRGDPAPVPLDTLVKAGWPNEHILAAAAVNRVHVALSTLRRLGFRDVLEHVDEGYRLDLDVSVVEGEP